MKSFKSIVTEEDAEMAADIPAMTGDTELETGDELDSVQGNGEAPLAAAEAEGVENAADQVADDIVAGDSEDVEPEDAPVASVPAEDGEPVASVEAPHEEPDGDEGPNPTAPSDNDGDEETPTVPETAAVQAAESLVIVQCGLIATESAMKINEAASTEAFLGATDVAAKQAVVEGFTDTVKGIWEKLKAFVIKIKDAIVRFVQKIIFYIKQLFAKVYAKIVKSMYAKKAQSNWGKAAKEVKLSVPPLIAKEGALTYGSQKQIVADNKKYISKIAGYRDAKKAKADYRATKSAMEADIKAYDKSAKGNEKEVKVATLFPSFGSASSFIKTGYDNSIKYINEAKNDVVAACDKELKELNAKDSASLHSAKVQAINMVASFQTSNARITSNVLVKCLRLAATSIKRVAGYKATKESYIDEDLMAFFNA